MLTCSFRTGVEKGMKLCTAVQEGCGAHRYYSPLTKYFTVCITYQPALVLLQWTQYYQGYYCSEGTVIWYLTTFTDKCRNECHRQLLFSINYCKYNSYNHHLKINTVQTGMKIQCCSYILGFKFQ